MTIPYADVSQTRGNGIVAFIDEKGNVVAKEAFASIFGKEKRGIGVGVLSDHYDALGWMSMSGQTYYLHGKDQNVYLTQMDADTLQAQLDELYFLVIDSYDVSSLGKEYQGNREMGEKRWMAADWNRRARQRYTGWL